MKTVGFSSYEASSAGYRTTTSQVPTWRMNTGTLRKVGRSSNRVDSGFYLITGIGFLKRVALAIPIVQWDLVLGFSNTELQKSCCPAHYCHDGFPCLCAHDVSVLLMSIRFKFQKPCVRVTVAGICRRFRSKN